MQTVEIENGTQLGFEDLLNIVQRFDNPSLSKFAHEVNQLVSKRNNTPDNREADLVKKLNKVIPTSIKKRQKQLFASLQQGTITPQEQEELLILNNILEEKAAERILLLGELAALRGITIQELVAQR